MTSYILLRTGNHVVSRFRLCCVALPFLAWTVQAQETTSPETLIRFNVQPMPAPKPALRYMLLPELQEMQPGNPIPNYLKCVLEAEASSDPEYFSRFTLRRADQAARLDKPDWQILLRAKTDGVSLLLPDVQKMRKLAAALLTRFREEVSQRKFDDAIVTAKTMLAMSRHLGEHPTLIGELVGIAIATLTIAPFEEMLAQTSCPNLYWALTNLPHPFISLDLGMQGERLSMVAELRDLDDQVPMSPDQLKKVCTRIDGLLKGLRGAKEGKTRQQLNERRKQPLWIAGAYNHLLDAGLPKERLREFPLDQVILQEEKRVFEISQDEVIKVVKFPYWQMIHLLDEAWRENVQARAQEPALFDPLMPAVHIVCQAQARIEQRLALLQHVEAIRMYAAEHNGKLPAKLSDISVPLPVDPFTGKPFRYQLDGETAHLRGTPPEGQKYTPIYNLHYEITIQKMR
jgi:hypothetical protein